MSIEIREEAATGLGHDAGSPWGRYFEHDLAVSLTRDTARPAPLDAAAIVKGARRLRFRAPAGTRCRSSPALIMGPGRGSA